VLETIDYKALPILNIYKITMSQLSQQQQKEIRLLCLFESAKQCGLFARIEQIALSFPDHIYTSLNQQQQECLQQLALLGETSVELLCKAVVVETIDVLADDLDKDLDECPNDDNDDDVEMADLSEPSTTTPTTSPIVSTQQPSTMPKL